MGWGREGMLKGSILGNHQQFEIFPYRMFTCCGNNNMAINGGVRGFYLLPRIVDYHPYQ